MQQQIRGLDEELRKTKEERDMAVEQLVKAKKKGEGEGKKDEGKEGALRFAMKVEERNQRAIEDLARALREVILECDEVKRKLEKREEELRRAKMEEERYREEAFVAWNEKERGFVGCMRRAEEEYREIEREREEWRVEKRKVRDLMKQALKEANIANQGAALAMVEVSQLKEEMEESRREKDKLCGVIRGLKIQMEDGRRSKQEDGEEEEDDYLDFVEGDGKKAPPMLAKFGSFLKRGYKKHPSLI